MALLKILGLVTLAILCTLIEDVAAIAENVVVTSHLTASLPTSIASSMLCSYETVLASDGSGISTLPGIACPHFFTINGSYENGLYNNYTSYNGGASMVTNTLVSTSTVTSTISPSDVTETITATSTISKWYNTTETFGDLTTTIHYIEIVSYSILSAHTTTFLVPPSPIVYTIQHTLTSTATTSVVEETPQPTTGPENHRRLSPSDAQHVLINASSDRDGSASHELGIPSSLSLNAELVSLSPANLSTLPIWTDTMGTGGDGTVSTSTVPAGMGTGTGTSSGGPAFSTVGTNNGGGGVNGTYMKPSPFLASTAATGGSGISSDGGVVPTTQQTEHKSPGVAKCLDHTVALLAALVVIFA